jgi:hypothetical protein
MSLLRVVLKGICVYYSDIFSMAKLERVSLSVWYQCTAISS